MGAVHAVGTDDLKGLGQRTWRRLGRGLGESSRRPDLKETAFY